MGDSILGKISIYDILAMLIPGGLIVYTVYRWVSPPLPELHLEDANWITIALFLITSYAVGLVYHKLIVEGCLFETLYNNDVLDISRERLKVLNFMGQEDPAITTKPLYYKAYYVLEKVGLGDIKVLEAQVVFLKNILFVLSLALATLLGEEDLVQTEAFILDMLCLSIVSVVYGFKLGRDTWRFSNHYSDVYVNVSVCMPAVFSLGIMLGELPWYMGGIFVAVLLYAVALLSTISKVQTKIYNMVWERYYYLVKNEA